MQKNNGFLNGMLDSYLGLLVPLKKLRGKANALSQKSSTSILENLKMQNNIGSLDSTLDS